ncbi:hypothetical protein JW949_02110 [Candidatus Woesearchaeota archaeon]|nr:hypothetical protein [Candidatus Woesearchaeota archaeon]
MRLSLKEELKRMGYNAKERVYIYSGAFTGAIAPIVAVKYILTSGIQSSGWIEEVIGWGGSILINASPMIKEPHLPVPFYTGMAGMIFGAIGAESSKIKRYEKSLEDITKEASE